MSLGFVSQDLLLLLAPHSNPPFVKKECWTDGLCACLRRGYCFDPSGHPIRDNHGRTHPSPAPSEVKKNWKQLSRHGLAHASCPAWYEAQYYLAKAVARYQSMGYLSLKNRLGQDDRSVIGPTPTGRTFELKVFVKEHPSLATQLQILLWLRYGNGHLMSRYFAIDPGGKVTDEGGV